VTETHPHFCDCDACLGPGLKLPHPPIVYTTLGRPPMRLKDQPRRAVEYGADALSPSLLAAAYRRVMQRRAEGRNR
jgi:hypothetical protein